MKTCSLCSKPLLARGFCKSHYRAFMKYGDPRFKANLRGEPFEARYKVDVQSGCWLWVGGLVTDGYGVWNAFGESRAHRASFVKHKGPIPLGMCVLHQCDNPACVNPKHLFLGTHEENMEDMRTKGRARGMVGSAHHKAKLTDAQAISIMRDPRSQKEIAAEFDLSVHAVDHIQNGVAWRHLFKEDYRKIRLAARRQPLSAQQKTAIKKDLRRQIDIAAEYGVSQTLISLIKRTT